MSDTKKEKELRELLSDIFTGKFSNEELKQLILDTELKILEQQYELKKMKLQIELEELKEKKENNLNNYNLN